MQARPLLLLTFALAPFGASGQPHRHVETISQPQHEYTLRLGGNMDAANTRDPIVYAAWKQGFEPMRTVKLENTGDTDVVNPWILVNGKRNWRTAEDIVHEALAAYGEPGRMTDAEKARALWEFLRRNRFHATTGNFEVRDPVKMFNVYGFALCGDNAPALMDLWRLAGLKARRGFPIGHCVAEAWYDGGWHMLDGDESIIFLERDNRTIAAEEAVARDHDLSKRTYPSEDLPALYNYDGTRAGDYPSHLGHRMDLTLRPGESLEWRFGQGERHHYAPNPVLFLLRSTNLHEWGPEAWATLRNGKWTYTPPLGSAAARRGVDATNARWGGGKGGPAVTPAAAGMPATLTWKIRTPYVIVGGRLQARVAGAPADQCTFSISYDGRTWKQAAHGTGGVDVSLDPFFASPGDPHYEYYLRAELTAARNPRTVGLASLTVENDLQMAPLAMPELELGENRISYTDETPGARTVRTTFEWEERTGPPAPAPPTAPAFPADAAAVEGTALAFTWPASGAAAAYHFELADEPTMRWALSPGFEDVVKQPRFPLRSAGLLTPGRKYYWRVRAKSAEGVWGAWSATWSFTAQAPGIPRNLRFAESEPGITMLTWDAAGEGRRPARYRVYASDEKGFTVRDAPYDVATGNQTTRGLFPGKKSVRFPANFVGETAEPGWRVEPGRAFYRVVAVDAQGNRSGSSEFAEAPRPWIYTKPPREARVGAPYRYEPRTVRSIGDLSYRDFGPDESYQSAFWDADRPVFSLETEMPRCGNFVPEWLKIDPQTGLLSGTPQPGNEGEYQVNIRVRIEGRVHVQSYALTVSR